MIIIIIIIINIIIRNAPIKLIFPDAVVLNKQDNTRGSADIQ